MPRPRHQFHTPNCLLSQKTRQFVIIIRPDPSMEPKNPLSTVLSQPSKPRHASLMFLVVPLFSTTKHIFVPVDVQADSLSLVPGPHHLVHFKWGANEIPEVPYEWLCIKKNKSSPYGPCLLPVFQNFAEVRDCTRSSGCNQGHSASHDGPSITFSISQLSRSR